MYVSIFLAICQVLKNIKKTKLRSGQLKGYDIVFKGIAHYPDTCRDLQLMSV
jgi:hypothetical protein